MPQCTSKTQCHISLAFPQFTRIRITPIKMQSQIDKVRSLFCTKHSLSFIKCVHLKCFFTFELPSAPYFTLKFHPSWSVPRHTKYWFCEGLIAKFSLNLYDPTCHWAHKLVVQTLRWYQQQQRRPPCLVFIECGSNWMGSINFGFMCSATKVGTGTSVTRLGDFWKFFTTNFRSKIAHIFSNFLGHFENIT